MLDLLFKQLSINKYMYAKNLTVIKALFDNITFCIGTRPSYRLNAEILEFLIPDFSIFVKPNRKFPNLEFSIFGLES